MAAGLRQDLRFEPCEDVESLANTAVSIMVDDILAQRLTVPSYESVFFTRVGKLSDGRVVGGVVGFAKWTVFHLTHIAVHPDFQHRGIGTTLLRAVEAAARTTFRCNQIQLELFSWQSRRVFEKCGYKMAWTLCDCPRGHATHYMRKEWSLASREEPFQGYAGATEEVLLVEENEKETTALLQSWTDADRMRRNERVPPRVVKKYGLKVLHADGSVAAVCVYQTCWNMLHVVMLAVVREGSKRGVGSATLRKIDELARQHDCDHVTLKTMSWQARPFYEKNGFIVAITERDVPFGFARYTMYRDVPGAQSSKL